MVTDSRVSSALGVPLPQWIIDQLNTRSMQSSKIARDTDNIIYQGNKTAWIRMVSSVDIMRESTKKYFVDLGVNITDPSSLAKLFVLQGGVVSYEGNGSGFAQYQLRSGFPQAYNVVGNSEVLNYGYRPMPGITSVRVQTQGKLGSVRSADIQLKVWDKQQLDIIDALYFKLGYTMFIEWGHTYYYDNNGVLQSGAQPTVDPFANGLSKEDILNQISYNINKSKGNYDAMLGIVTNFNFTYNQEGGYDCSIKLMALGSLISSMKLNNPRILPDLRKDVVEVLVNTIIKEEERRQRLLQQQQQNQLSTDTTTTTTTLKPVSLNEFFEEKIKASPIEDSLRDYFYLPTQTGGGTKINDPAKADIVYDSEKLWGIRKFGVVLSADNATDQISSVTLSANSIKQNLPFTYVDEGGWFSKDKTYKVSNADDFAKIPPLAENVVTDDVKFFSLEYAQRALLGRNFDLFELNYFRDDNQEVFTGGKLQTIKLKRNYKLHIFINRAVLRGTTGITGGWDRETTDFEKEQVKKAVFNQIINQNISVSQSGGKIAMSFEKVDFKIDPFRRGQSEKELERNPYTNKVNTTQTLKYRPNLFIYNNLSTTVPIDPSKKDPTGATSKQLLIEYVVNITDSGLIEDLKLSTSTNRPILEFLDREKKLASQNQIQTPPVTPPEPALKVSDIQTNEALKYQSAFEVMIRTLQLYSLDTAINSQIDVDKKVRTIALTGDIYKSFTKQLFSVGIFANMLDDLVNEQYPLEQLCKTYDEEVQSKGTMTDKDAMLKLRAFFGFHFGLMGNVSKAMDLYPKCKVNYKELLKTYVIPYEFNTGVFEGTQINHPVYLPLGLVIMILNHVCGIYDSNGKATFSTPLVYLDYNPVSNLCMSNAKHLSTNPYDVLIPFQGETVDYQSLIDPSVLQVGKNGQLEIQPVSGSTESTPLFNIRDRENGDRISPGLLEFKLSEGDTVDTYRGRTMNVLISVDYLLRVVSSYSKNNGSGDIYFKEFIEQILFDINKYLGDINLFRLAYDDAGNTARIVDDQFIPNLENKYADTNKTMLPLFGSGSIARSVEIRTDMSNKLNNMLAISANSNVKDQSMLSKNGDSVGFYNASYKDRYIPFRGEFTSSVTLPTDTMINSAIQFNKAIETFYSEAKPAESSVSHATNYYIERMSKIKGEEKGTRAAAMIPVSLNFSMDGISGLGMGHAFTISEQFLPYNYNLSLTDPFGEKDQQNTVGFVMVGLDQTIEGNQWISNIRANMVYLKKRQDFEALALKKLEAPTQGLNLSETGVLTLGPTNLPTSVKNSSNFQKFISQPGVKEKVESIAAEIGVKPDDLYIIFRAETAGTFDSSIQNKDSKATGLIQFLPKTAEGLGTSVKDLKEMGALKQLDYVRKYFINRKGQYKNAYDLYMQTFFPLALGKPANFVIQTASQSAELISKQNPAIAKAAGKTPGQELTVADFYKYVSSFLV